MCAGPLKPPKKPKPAPTPAPVVEPLKADESEKAAREAGLRRRRRAAGAFDSTIVTGPTGVTGEAQVRKKRLLGE